MIDAFRIASLILVFGNQLFLGQLLPNVVVPLLSGYRAKGIEREGWRSGRQGRNPAGESPAMSIACFGHVAMPQFMLGNRMFYAWCIRPGCPCGYNHSGRCNLEVEQVWELEHNGMTATP